MNLYSFQIMEMQDLGPKLRMVVMAHRRINLLKKHDELPLTTMAEQEQPELTGKSDQQKVVKQEEEIVSIPEPETGGLLLAETENLVHDPFDTTDEVKALTQEIIKTIRDIIVR